ncbi:CHAT domain-containing tetratricopeptide repeat protein [Ichthyenterobacterium sp. W332]|uniref:CHAT domain-containing tetratricopeptide repeat protein n=1 Tax=Microcosmobacter mediterraneus TaxID=3075607 RepID=A0ABU2YHE7_9FLAO|nr:CHAT domain-containing tetratricopeptide repeat protein [Ichthyenterobacterium sp. W332]MDT0557568.1 CHAT domain-containing tetratricopeptide repeat protein [Ichthyenterobacterium sp. W332]
MRKLILLIFCVFSIHLFGQEITDVESWEKIFKKGVQMTDARNFSAALPFTKLAYDSANNYFDEVDENYLESLHYYGICLYMSGDIKSAEPLMELDLKLTEKHKGKDHNDYGERLNNIGLLYQNTGKYKEAEFVLTEALKNRETIHGKQHEEYSTTLSNLGSLYVKMRQYEKALTMLKEALAIVENRLGKSDYNYIIQSGNVAVTFQQMGKYNEALPLFLNCRDFVNERSGKKNINFIVYTINIGLMHYFLNDYKSSIKECNLALEIIAELGGKKNYYYGLASSNLAMNYSALQDYERAIELYLESKLILEKSSKKSVDYGILLANIGQTYLQSGDYQNALKYMELSLKHFEENIGVDNDAYGTLLANLTIIYGYFGDYDTALKTGKNAVKLIEENIGKNNDQYCKAINNLGQIYAELDDYDKAIDLANDAYEIYDSLFEDDNHVKGKYLQNIAFLHNYKGDTNTAIEVIQNAIGFYNNSSEEGKIDHAIALNNLASFYSSINDIDKSLETFNDALELISDFANPKSIIYKDLQTNYGLTLLKNNDFEEAIKFIATANNNNISILENIFKFRSEIEKKKYLKTLAADFDNISSAYIRHDSKKVKPLIGISLNNELLLKGVLLNASKNTLSQLLALEDSLIDKKIFDYRAVKAEISKQYSLSPIDRYKSIDSLYQVKEIQESDLVQLYSDKFNDKISFGKDWKSIRDKLNRREVAVEFSHFKYRYGNVLTDSVLYAAYIIKPNTKEPILVSLFEEEELERLINKSNKTDLYIKNNLYNLIWEPLERHIKKSDIVYYSPSGILNQIQFSAISNGKKSLSELYNLVQVSSCSKIVKGLSMIEANDAMFFGGINYDPYDYEETQSEEVITDPFNLKVSDSLFSSLRGTKTRGENWDYLPATLKEIQNLQELLTEDGKTSKVFTQYDASEKNFKLLSGKSPKILHIATHGFFYENLENRTNNEFSFDLNTEDQYRLYKDPLLRSGLILSGANKAWKNGVSPNSIEDGILTALEISNLDLSNTEVVVLSACETGLGDINGSEGVYGLQRAFKMAGVDILIMSLWKVPDNETAEFMTLFYSNWLETDNIRLAFNNAQQVLQNKYRNEPVKWAGFILLE